MPAHLRSLVGKEIIAVDGAVEGTRGEEVRHYHGLDGRDGGQRCTDNIRSAWTVVAQHRSCSTAGPRPCQFHRADEAKYSPLE